MAEVMLQVIAYDETMDAHDLFMRNIILYICFDPGIIWRPSRLEQTMS